jgi:hypothetical protein
MAFCTAAGPTRRPAATGAQPGRFLRLAGHRVDSRRHVQHRLAGFADLAQLLGRGGQQLGGRAFHLRRGLRHLGGRVLHVAHQLAQFFHRVVHRVGDGAGDVLGHRGFLRQVAFGHRLQFVHQAKNGGLVGVVDALGFLLLALGFEALRLGHFLALAAVLHLHVGQADGAGDGEHGGQQQGGQGDRAQAGLARTACPAVLPAPAQRLAVGNDGRLRFARGHQALQVAQDGAGLRAGLFVRFSSASRRSRVCGSLEPARRSSGLPSSRPCAISLKEFRSLPSRNTASGLTPSTVRNSLADLPMRCVSITSWPAAEISAGAAFCCSLSEDTVSAISSRSDDWRLMVRSAVPTCVRIFCCCSTVPGVLLGALHQRHDLLEVGLQFDRTGFRRRFVVAVLQAAHRTGQHRGAVRTSGKACGLPTRACDTDLARRCDCISESPVLPHLLRDLVGLAHRVDGHAASTTSEASSSSRPGCAGGCRWCGGPAAGR